MRVLGYTWAGVRTGDLKSATRFFTDALGLSPIHESDALTQFEMPSAQVFEVFGLESRYHRLHASPVLAFQVEDVRAARKELGVTRRPIRHPCRGQRVRSLDLFSRPRRLLIPALADTSSPEGVAGFILRSPRSDYRAKTQAARAARPLPLRLSCAIFST